MSPILETASEPKRRLRVLVLAPAFPFPPVSGFNVRSSQLTRQIARHHDVTFLSYVWPHDEPHDGPEVDELTQSIEIRVVRRGPQSTAAKRLAQVASLASNLPFACQALHSREMQQAIDELTASTRFDVIHIESASMTTFRFPSGVPIVLDEHNIEYELYERLYRGESHFLRRLYNRIEFVRMRRFEQQRWRRVQACAVTSEREQPVVRALAAGTHTAVVPNGVDLDYFASYDGEVTPRTAVLVGVLNYRPNADAARFLVHEVWPLVRRQCPDAVLTLVGTVPEPEARALAAPGVEVVGRVPDVRPYLRSAAVVTVPVRMGGGTRLKVVEALALGKAIVSTSLGCEGIAVRDGEHVLLADTAAAFAERILELFESPELRGRLGASGRALAETYSWDVAGDRLEALYRRTVPAAAEDLAAPQARASV